MTVRRHPNAGIPMIHIRSQVKGGQNTGTQHTEVTGTRKTIKIINVAKSMIMAIVFVSIVLIPLFYHHFTIVNFQAPFGFQEIVCGFRMEHTKELCNNHDQAQNSTDNGDQIQISSWKTCNRKFRICLFHQEKSITDHAKRYY